MIDETIKLIAAQDLEPPLLDLYVAKALNRTAYLGSITKKVMMDAPGKWEHVKTIEFSPSTKWFHGGPLLEKYHINVVFECEYEDGDYQEGIKLIKLFSAYVDGDDPKEDSIYGTSYLIAGMRCLVNKLVGAEVDADLDKVTATKEPDLIESTISMASDTQSIIPKELRDDCGHPSMDQFYG